MQLHKLTCSYISLHGVPECSRIFQNVLECMQIHELARNYISLHAITQACMQLHKLACSFCLRLSSSQELRSACLVILLEQSQLLGDISLSRRRATEMRLESRDKEASLSLPRSEETSICFLLHNTLIVLSSDLLKG